MHRRPCVRSRQHRETFTPGRSAETIIQAHEFPTSRGVADRGEGGSQLKRIRSSQGVNREEPSGATQNLLTESKYVDAVLK